MIGKAYNLSTVVMHMICGFFYLYPGTNYIYCSCQFNTNQFQNFELKSMNFYLNHFSEANIQCAFRKYVLCIIILQSDYMHPSLMPFQPTNTTVLKSIMLTLNLLSLQHELFFHLYVALMQVNYIYSYPLLITRPTKQKI